MMLNYLMSSSTTLLQVIFGPPTGLLPSTSSSSHCPKYAILIPMFYMNKQLSQPFYS